jgi:hypothetical protein
MTTTIARDHYNPGQEQDGLVLEQEKGQYSLWQILVIWILAAIPMGLLSWVVFPAVSPDFNSDPLGAGITRLVLLTIGLVWLFVLSMIIVRNVFFLFLILGLVLGLA